MRGEEKQKAINALKISAPIMAVTQEEFKDYIQTLNKIMDWLEQEPCDDSISRQAVLSMQYRIDDSATLSTRDVVNVDDIEDLPPVIPKPKTGHWTKTNNYFPGDYENIDYFKRSCCQADSLEQGDYCPNCGAKIVCTFY